MLTLLVASALTYLILGDLEESLTLVVSVFVVVVGITLYQENKTERTLYALRDLSSPRALVVRGGGTMRVAGRDVVRGDVLILAEGDRRVPADATVLSASGLTADESLPGESVPVPKSLASERPFRDSQFDTGSRRRNRVPCSAHRRKVVGADALHARTLTFTTLIMTNLMLIATNLSLRRRFSEGSSRQNVTFLWLAGAALTALGVVLFVPQAQDLFLLASLRPADLLVWAAAGLAAFVWMSTAKQRLSGRDLA
jgi:magnesium-transporting ATPase (P-type)